LYRIINNNNQKAEQGAIAWQTEASRRNEITSLNNSLGQIAEDRASLETHFVQSSDVVTFLDTFGEIATLSGTKAEIDSVDTGTNNSELVVGLKVTGSFGAVYKFLTLLENFPYELDFISMDMHEEMVPSVSSKNIIIPDWEADFKIQLLSFVP
jgi:hypothetical protein